MFRGFPHPISPNILRKAPVAAPAGRSAPVPLWPPRPYPAHPTPDLSQHQRNPTPLSLRSLVLESFWIPPVAVEKAFTLSSFLRYAHNLDSLALRFLNRPQHCITSIDWPSDNDVQSGLYSAIVLSPDSQWFTAWFAASPPFSGSMDSCFLWFRKKGIRGSEDSETNSGSKEASSVSLDSANGYSSTGTDEALAARCCFGCG